MPPSYYAYYYDSPPVGAVMLVAAGTAYLMSKEGSYSKKTTSSDKDPAPIAATFSYGDSAVTYKLIYRTTEEDRWPVRNELVTRIWYAARRHGLTLPYPIVSNLRRALASIRAAARS